MFADDSAVISNDDNEVINILNDIALDRPVAWFKNQWPSTVYLNCTQSEQIQEFKKI